MIAGAVVVVATAVGVAGALGLGGDEADSDGAGGRSSGTTRVTRGTLTDETKIDGNLGHGPQVPVPVRAEGTVTWLPQPGDTVRRGQTLLRVDDRPVVLFYGSLPMYRGLAVDGARPADGSGDGGTDARGAGDGGARGDAGGPGADGGTTGGPGDGRSDGPGSGGGTAGGTGPGNGPAGGAGPLRGMDVKQFETNLAALGYGGFTVDDTYSSLTADAVERWQQDLGLPPTGTVGIRDVVYAPGPVRIAGTTVRVGAEAGGEPLTYTSTSRMVVVDAPAADMGWAKRGTEVTVDLPDGRSVKGRVSRIGTEAAPARGDAPEGAGATDGGAAENATVQVVVTFADQEALGRLEGGPVTVRYVSRERRNVLTVPVAALVALAEGGHGLELADGAGDAGTGGPGRFVPVETGLFADGRVEVSGPGVREGMKVRIPR
ncbi:peptidoglycan-binding protein [Streptomyces pactum]|uniref:peptidoglycan-binding protein n=1 Tax=Streptomyces pactum TaxID=68249 RepID=UPI0027DC6623|nr:peptidoglycan-binding protein [Streptomyces pactum]